MVHADSIETACFVPFSDEKAFSGNGFKCDISLFNVRLDIRYKQIPPLLSVCLSVTFEFLVETHNMKLMCLSVHRI
jgi:hypothetical protein